MDGVCLREGEGGVGHLILCSKKTKKTTTQRCSLQMSAAFSGAQGEKCLEARWKNEQLLRRGGSIQLHISPSFDALISSDFPGAVLNVNLCAICVCLSPPPPACFA